MKITQNNLSIPPYLSTTWDQINALYVKDGSLVISLKDKSAITIPGLTEPEIESIFTAHATFLETLLKLTQHIRERPPSSQPMQIIPGYPFPLPADIQGENIIPLRLNLDNIETLASSLQHTPSQAHLPDLPVDMVNKIAAIAKIVAPEEMQSMPKPEAHCNCPHCQILRAIRGDSKEIPHEHIHEPTKEEEVSPDDLSFQEWNIKQTGDRLYTVTNKLDELEKYNVFLGEPVGCTCGVPGCAHILAVLKS
ncbi:MAG: hypothetical protein WCF65_00585 [Parachlamydiaceae bacterium]